MMFNKSYNVAATERANKELANSFIKYNVKLLDESIETFHLSTQARGMNLLDSICDCLELIERDYFGIQYRHNDSSASFQNLKWMRMDKLIRKEIKGDITSKIFYLRVRFVPEDLVQITESYTRYQLFLQIKQDIYNNRISCSKDIAVQLAGCSLQSELNDFNNGNIKPGYVGEFRFIQEQTPAFEADVANFHKSLRGIRPEEAELKFLTIARLLFQYGCDIFTCELMDKPTQIGFQVIGISIFPPERQGAFIIPWNALNTVLHKNKTFLIKVLLSQPIYSIIDGGASYSFQIGKKANLILYDYIKSGFKLVFPTINEAKEAWRSCIDSHSFFRVRDPRQIQSRSASKPSHSFFKLLSVHTLFSGQRTLPEIVEVKRRNRALERSFIRTPSKRYIRKYPVQIEKQINLSESLRPQGIIQGKANRFSTGSMNIKDIKEKFKNEKMKDVENSDSEISDKEMLQLDPDQFRPKSSITQSVRLDQNNHSKEFAKLSITHSSMPKKQPNSSSRSLNLNNDKKDRNVRVILKETLKPESKSSRSNISPRPSSSIYETKSQVLPKSQTQLRSRLSESMSSMKNSFSISNSTMNQSNDKLVDLDSCVEITIKPQDNKYGFTIRGGSDSGSQVIVSKVSPGSAADVCVPNLFEGDQIIKINEKFAEELTNDEIKEIIRSTGQKKDNLLVLTVKSRLYIGEDSTVSEERGTDDEDSCGSTMSRTVTNDLQTEINFLEESLKNGTAVSMFEKLYKQKQGLTANEARKSDNINKNRYKDILPYDQTRIIIRNGDYINGSLIKFDVPKSTFSCKYIATQGPLMHTSNDFWCMIWENKINLIVMLTDLQEKGRVKCFKYWPSLNETIKLSHSLQITCGLESIYGVYVIKEMKLKKGTETRKITHLQYLNWPDHDVPQKMDDFLLFMKTMRQLRTNKSESILVHCSAGIGRTGVVITMDIAMYHMELKQPFYVLAIVKEIRNQRAMLIQSQKQYDFVCRAIINYYSSSLK